MSTDEPKSAAFHQSLEHIPDDLNSAASRLPSHRPFVELNPFDQALVWFICTVSGRWQSVEWTALSSLEERAIVRLIGAGLLEARGLVQATAKGYPHEYRLRCRVRGDYAASLIKLALQREPEWMSEDGVIKADVSVKNDITHLRLTDQGEVARHDWQSRRETSVLPMVRGAPGLSPLMETPPQVGLEHIDCVQLPTQPMAPAKDNAGPSSNTATPFAGHSHEPRSSLPSLKELDPLRAWADRLERWAQQDTDINRHLGGIILPCPEADALLTRMSIRFPLLTQRLIEIVEEAKALHKEWTAGKPVDDALIETLAMMRRRVRDAIYAIEEDHRQPHAPATTATVKATAVTIQANTVSVTAQNAELKSAAAGGETGKRNAKEPQKRMTVAEAQQWAETYVKNHPWPGLNEAARQCGCSKPTMMKAIEASPIIQRAKASLKLTTKKRRGTRRQPEISDSVMRDEALNILIQNAKSDEERARLNDPSVRKQLDDMDNDQLAALVDEATSNRKSQLRAIKQRPSNTTGSDQ